MASSYSTDPEWADITPLPQDDGENPLAQISYTQEYAEAMSYLRAVMAKNEMSERALQLTGHVIEMNPAHYTVWLYRAKMIFGLGKDLREEVGYLNQMALEYEKNYQIWNHRQTMVDRLGDATGEAEFIAQMLEKDSKNYHVWSYRQWLVQRFDLWEKGEIEYLDGLIKEDVRNNSAWNHRFYVLFSRELPVDKETINKEIRYTEEAIDLAPQNPSPWNYLKGLLKKSGLPLSTVESLCQKYAPVGTPENIRSSHALDILAEIYAERPGGRDAAVQALDLLASKYDPIRLSYWRYRKTTIKEITAQ